MTGPITQSTSVGLSQRTNVYAERKMLEHAMPVMVLEKLAETKQMPKNKSSTIKFRRPNVFAPATTPLMEGVTPPPTPFTFTDVEVQLRQYGMVTEHTDVIADLHEDPVLNEQVIQLGENVGRTAEALDFGVVRGGTNVFYANGANRAAVNTPISLAKQRAVVRSLQAQKAKKISRILAPSVNYETRAIEAAYFAVCHTDVVADIRNMAGFVPVAEYGQRQPMCPEEVGSVEDVRYIASPDLPPWVGAGSGTKNGMFGIGANVDVYPVIFFGQNAWAKVALRGQGAITPSIISVDTKTKDDPLGQVGKAGWKMYHAALITNQAWMLRLEVGVTAL